METLNKDKSPVDIALEEQRKESEARAILQDLERLITTPNERKRRWVWELIQNAKDSVSISDIENPQKVNITFHLSNNKLTFSHDGSPFALKDLLALVRRTSTKSYNNENGNTGKFGTGFVTTHALNRKVNVSGILRNELGDREFSICVDRTSETLEGLQRELDNVFVTINSFYEKSPQKFETRPLTKYEYELEDETYQLAEDSLDELKKNLPFTLLINPVINSVRVIDDQKGENKIYSLTESTPIISGLFFSKLTTDSTVIEEDENGLLHFTENNITIAIPFVKKDEISWLIEPIDKQARLYREFPLIGTEQWHIPFFVQSSDFIPSEERDGVRTLKDNENKADLTADQNRITFVNLKKTVINFFKQLQTCSIEKMFLLAECGLPIEKTEYTSSEWFIEHIQNPLREFFLGYPLLKTASGDAIAINNAKFPNLYEDEETNISFYKIGVKYFYDQFPTEDDFRDWQRIITQEDFNWGSNLISSPEDLVEEISKENGLQPLRLEENESTANWLNDLITFLSKIGKSGLGENYNLYPNQEGTLSKKQEIRIDPPLNPKIKSVAVQLGIPVLRQLLESDIIHRDGIDAFDTKAFYNIVNKTIGDLTPSDDKQNAYKAIFKLICLFNDSTAKERDKWYHLAKQLLPEMVSDKEIIYDMTDFNFGSAELATIKYICWLIEKTKDFRAFCDTYFQADDASAYEWLNSFFEVLFRNQDYEELIRKYSVIPMQNGVFRKLENGIYREDKEAFFDTLFKELYTQYTGKGDAQSFLIAKEIRNEKLPWKTIKIITDELDNLFSSSDIEKRVEPNGQLNGLFHKLNDWFSTKEEEASFLFPHFSRHRPILYVKAFGPEVSKMVMAIHKLQKPIEEIEALVNLNMNSEELGQLIKASHMAGGTSKLLAVAAEIEREAKDAQWRKNVGDAAELAFIEAMKDVSVYDIENPDRGYDFEIHFEKIAPYLLEIKSTVQFKESIKMSGLQGRTARDNQKNYALCVLAREQSDTEVTKEYFINNAKFVINIGCLVENKVNGMENSLITINQYKSGEVGTFLDDEQYSVYVNRSAWKEALHFNTFVDHLQTYFQATQKLQQES